MKKKQGWYERSQHTGVFCNGCGAEMDMCGQIAHHSYCLVLRAIQDAPGSAKQQVQPDNSPKMCEECGEYPADSPSKLCCGCDAYKEHLS